MPNIEQVLSIVRWLLSVGGPLGAFLVSKGMSAEQVTVLSGSIIAIVGALPPLISVAWSMMAHTEAKAVAVVDALAKDPASPVKGVVVEPTAAGRELKEALPGNTVAVAGTYDAVALAKPNGNGV